ncbi:hypothetical protein [Rhizobium sp. A37_96]
MKLPFERTPRNASTVSAKRTQKRRFFARGAEIIADERFGGRFKPAASARLAAKRPEWRLYAWRKLTVCVCNPIALTNLATEIPRHPSQGKAGDPAISAQGQPFVRQDRHPTELERYTHGAYEFIVKP